MNRNTHRVRFENKAREKGATVCDDSNALMLHIIATDGKLHTYYYFDDEGNFVDSTFKKVD